MIAAGGGITTGAGADAAGAGVFADGAAPDEVETLADRRTGVARTRCVTGLATGVGVVDVAAGSAMTGAGAGAGG